MRGGESDRGVSSAVTRRPDVKAAVSFRAHRSNIGVKIGEAYLLSETDAENAWVADFEPLGILEHEPRIARDVAGGEDECTACLQDIFERIHAGVVITGDFSHQGIEFLLDALVR